MRLKIKDVIRQQKKSDSEEPGKSFDATERASSTGAFGLREGTKPPFGDYAAYFHPRIGRNSTTSSRKKVNHEMASGRFS